VTCVEFIKVGQVGGPGGGLILCPQDFQPKLSDFLILLKMGQDAVLDLSANSLKSLMLFKIILGKHKLMSSSHNLYAFFLTLLLMVCFLPLIGGGG